MQWDSGPSRNIAAVFENAPLQEYQKNPSMFRLEWGPIYYRGRTDGSARVLVIGQDPAADEAVARRVLVGMAGQRVQGFLAKIGITTSYFMVNSFLYSIYGQFTNPYRDFMDISPVRQWRSDLLDALIAENNIEAILAFGKAAHHMVDSWPGAAVFKNQNKVFYLTHPTAGIKNVFQSWNANLQTVAQKVNPDPGVGRNLSTYSGSNFKDSQLTRIPLLDFGFGAPEWMGTGNMAMRLRRNTTTIPKKAIKHPSKILWFAPNKT
jgi:uracil-DNA glycosylase